MDRRSVPREEHREVLPPQTGVRHGPLSGSETHHPKEEEVESLCSQVASMNQLWWLAPSNKKGGIVMVLPFFGAFEYGESTEGVAAGPDERGCRAEKCWGRG